MQDYYLFPAVFHYADDGISISFPDLPGCLSCADKNNLFQALYMAQDALECWIYSAERDNELVPEPSDIFKIKKNLASNEIVIPVKIFMPPVRERAKNNKSINKTVTLPQWLIIEGKRGGLNFSQILQEALKNKLGLK